MTLGRPRTDDTPAKYQASYRLYQLSASGSAGSGTAVEDVASYLEWSIEQGDEGFCEGDIINVSALAKGIGKSRNTAGKAVEMLVTKGMLLQDKPKSPYRIVSQTPIFEDTGVVADAQISLTRKFDAPSLISRVGVCRVGASRRDPIGRFLRDELAANRDPLVSEAAAEYWNRGAFQYYLRLRTVETSSRPAGALLEITYLHLSPEAAEVFVKGVASLRDHHVTQISLYPLLEECGLSDVRSGRSRATVAATPSLLLAELEKSVSTDGIDLSTFDAGQPVLKWSYGIFHPEANPMVTFSVCFVQTNLLSIFIRNLDVELWEGARD